MSRQPKPLSALIIEDDLYIREEIVTHYKRFASHVDEADSVPDATKKLRGQKYDIVSIDLNLTDDGTKHRDGLNILPLAKRMGALCFILSGYNDRETIREASLLAPSVIYIKKGGLYGPEGIIKDVFDEHIGRSIIMHFHNPLERLLKSKFLTSNLDFQKKIQEIFRAAIFNQNIMLMGETGSGKTYLVNTLVSLIHEVEQMTYGNNTEKVFYKLNLGSINPDEVEVTLFGLSQGGKQVQAGIFEKANGGTLFLDEIGRTSLTLQEKLLSALSRDEHGFYTFQTVGDAGIRKKTSFRLITGTCDDTEQMFQEGKFREDFYHRIASAVPLDIPPLRERSEDIEGFINFFLEQSPRAITISEDATSSLLEYSWPGNIRQLEKTINDLTQREVSKINKLDLPTYILNNEHPLITKKIERLYTRAVRKFIQDNGLSEYLKQVEQMALKDMMVQTEHKISKSADCLGIGRSKAYSIMERINCSGATGENHRG